MLIKFLLKIHISIETTHVNILIMELIDYGIMWYIDLVESNMIPANNWSVNVSRFDNVWKCPTNIFTMINDI